MDEIKQRIGEIIGEASMCWSDTPTGVFDSTKASSLIDEIMTHIKYPLSEDKPRFKFVVKEKLEGATIAGFKSATDAFDYAKKLGEGWEVKETY
jgi:hypothetical protein